MTEEPRSMPVSLKPIFAVVFISTLGFSIVIPFLVFVVIRLGGNSFVYGIVGATYSAFQLVGAPVLGRWSDRYGRRRILLLSQAGTLMSWLLFLAALAMPVTPLAAVETRLLGAFTLTTPLLLLFVARALDGLTGGNVSVANAYVADVTPEAGRSASFGKMAVAQNLGFIAGPAIAGLLASTGWGDSAPVTAALAISGVALVMIALGLPEAPRCAWVDRPELSSVRKILGQEARDCHEVSNGRRLSLREVFALEGVALLLTIQFLVFLAFNVFYVALPMHAATNLGWSMRGVGLFLSFLSAVLVVVQGPLLGRLSRHWSDRELIAVGGLALAFSFLLFQSNAIRVLLVGAVVLAVGNGMLWPSLLALLSKTAGSAAQGSVQGVAGSAGALASIVGLVVGGALYQSLGSGIFAVAAAITFVAWLASLGTRPGRTTEP